MPYSLDHGDERPQLALDVRAERERDRATFYLDADRQPFSERHRTEAHVHGQLNLERTAAVEVVQNLAADETPASRSKSASALGIGSNFEIKPSPFVVSMTTLQPLAAASKRKLPVVPPPPALE